MDGRGAGAVGLGTRHMDIEWGFVWVKETLLAWLPRAFPWPGRDGKGGKYSFKITPFLRISFSGEGLRNVELPLSSDLQEYDVEIKNVRPNI